MLCEKCAQNQATIHMTQIVNGEKKELHLCEHCAKQSGVMPEISFQDFFKNMIDFAAPFMKKEEGDTGATVVRCSKCNMSYEEFRTSGMVGCDHCYKTFHEQMENIIRRIHANSEHVGKFPKKEGGQLLLYKEKETLKKKLQKAIENEEYELAAQLRDQIKQLGGEQ